MRWDEKQKLEYGNTWENQGAWDVKFYSKQLLSIARDSSIDREAQVRGGARRQKREESLATRPLGRIFIFANSGFNFRTWGFFMRFKDKPGGRGGGPPCSSLKSFHKEYPSFQLTFKSTCSPLLSPPPLPTPRLFRFLVFFVLSSTCPRLDVPLFHSRYRFRVYLQGFFFFPRPSCFVILHFYERV